MLEAILGILGSGSVGSIIGLAGGYMNRRLDLEVERIKVADKQAERDHDLKRLESERATMQAEYGMRLQVADKENEGKEIEKEKEIEVAGYGAMGESYKFAAPTPADGWVDKFSKVIRPLLTLLAVVFTAYVFNEVNQLMARLMVTPDPAKVLAIWITIIEWALFQSGVIIGWWFAMRPGSRPK